MSVLIQNNEMNKLLMQEYVDKMPIRDRKSLKEFHNTHPNLYTDSQRSWFYFWCCFC